ncbi:MAG: phosphoserine phosphatase RsbU/P [Solirubrobacteraceae bacterium]|nr:phosphoserine phosphatase RsbU/P [Solirubrobacteraceae bacterium]
MHDAAAEVAHAVQRGRHVGHGEVRQRCGVPGAAPACVDADRRRRAAGLAPAALVLGAIVQRLLEQALPEPPRPLGVVGRELDEGGSRAGDPSNLPSSTRRVRAPPRRDTDRYPRRVAIEAGLIPDDEDARLEAVRRYDVLDTPPDGAFDRVTALAASHFRVPISIVSIVDRDRIWFKSGHGVDVAEIGRDPGLCASAILQHGPWIVDDAAVDPRTLANPLVAGEFGLRFYAGVPLTTTDGFNLGTLCLLDREPRRLSDEETATLTDMAAIVMDQLELRLSARMAVDHEHALRDQAERTARSLQRSLLPPSLPSIAGVQLAALYRPVDASQVGGDFYDVFELHSGGWALAVGDVSGKGPAAAAVTSLARHAIRTASLSTDDPAQVLALLNRALFLGRTEEELEHYCTAHLSFLEPGPAGGFTLRTAAAGHPPALVLRPGGRPEQIRAPGPPAGWHVDARYASTLTALAGDDVVLIYTDGLSEARRGSELLGEDELARVLEASRGERPEAVTARLLDTLAAADVLARDDAAALVVKIV